MYESHCTIIGTHVKSQVSGSAKNRRPTENLFIISPATNSFIDKTEVTVTGRVFTSAREAGVTVNGVPATIHGDQYTARVLLATGENIIRASATDSNGASAAASITVYADTLNPVRIIASTESGLSPLETELRVDGLPEDSPNPITVTSPGAVDFTNCTRYDACKVRMTTEGIYYFTATTAGPDGTSYTDTIAITVLNKARMDALLKEKWEGMKAAFRGQDINSTVSYFSATSREVYRKHFTRLSSYIQQMAEDMGEFRLADITDWLAEYDLRTIRNGQTYSFQVLFVKDRDGMWRIRSF